MRPELLFPLFSNLESLSGIGPRIAILMEKLTGPYLIDLLFHLPRDVVDRSYMPLIRDCEAGKIATIKINILKHEAPSTNNRPYRVICTDETGFLTLTFFRANKSWIQKQLPIGETRFVSGKAEKYMDQLQISHPDFIIDPTEDFKMPEIEPIYPLGAGITSKTMTKAIQQSIKRLPNLPEWIDPHYLKKQNWPDWKSAVTVAHNPKFESDILPDSTHVRRLAFDELLSNQLALALTRERIKKQKGRILSGDNSKRQKIIDSLPFQLTKSQSDSLDEIYRDMGSNDRMLRLLQGDVGSGKTIVALLAMVNAIETGAQAALMAPTDILARQHYDGLKPLCDQAKIKIDVLTGRDKGKKRLEKLEALINGDIQILVGTHALFQKDVIYKDLALAIIDEQHRFGVQQRLELAEKGHMVDMLVMTATPIPRTLTMTAYGDLDVSKLTDKPPGRKPIQTIVVSQERITEVVSGLARKIKEGAKIYWVCPLVEESELLDLPAVTDRHEELKAFFGEDRVALVHGKMKAKEKDLAMMEFIEGDANILVATTVIEVGVNVPEATIMVIDHAEHFGLAQLHQLRGRIGRGDQASTCILLRSNRLSETAKQRLKVMSESEDGFFIAEKDLQLRGSGEVLGTKQSGLPEMKIASLTDHTDLMKAAFDDARLIIHKDPDLQSERGKALRHLLYLHQRDQAIANLRSG